MIFGDWRDDIIAEHDGRCPTCRKKVRQVLMRNNNTRSWYLVEESPKGLVAHECQPKEVA